MELIYPVGFWKGECHSLLVKLPPRMCATLFRLMVDVARAAMHLSTFAGFVIKANTETLLTETKDTILD